MTVAELIQDLLLVDQTLEVWLASDAEGNNFNPIDGNGRGWTRELRDEIDEQPGTAFDDVVLVFWPVG